MPAPDKRSAVPTSSTHRAGVYDTTGDSDLYLRRDGETLSLSVEHRAAAAMSPMTIELAQRGDALALEVADGREPTAPHPGSLDERIIATLADVPISRCRSPN